MYLVAIDGHSSTAFVTECLLRPTRMTARTRLPVTTSSYGRVIPIRFCSWWGLPCRGCYQPRGALLPHPFTLTNLLRHYIKKIGGLLSVALSLGSPPPGITRHHCFVEPGLSSPNIYWRRPSSRLARPKWPYSRIRSSSPASKRVHSLSIKPSILLGRQCL